jgi:NADH-quinone oxidoreductase subunit B
MATISHYDLARFGSERVSFFSRQADMLMVMGTISKNGTYTSGIRANVRTKMGYCSWRLCFFSGGIFDTYSTLQRDKVYWLTFTYQVVLKTGANVDGVI